MNDKATLEVGQLRQFEPISALSDERLGELVSLAYVEKLSELEKMLEHLKENKNEKKD